MFVWETKQRPGIALVHLVGDAALSVDMPHGNSKSSQPRAHHRTAKSTMLEMKTVSEKPSAYYRRKRGQVASDPASQVCMGGLVADKMEELLNGLVDVMVNVEMGELINDALDWLVNG